VTSTRPLRFDRRAADRTERLARPAHRLENEKQLRSSETVWLGRSWRAPQNTWRAPPCKLRLHRSTGQKIRPMTRISNRKRAFRYLGPSKSSQWYAYDDRQLSAAQATTSRTVGGKERVKLLMYSYGATVGPYLYPI
jgi:hypothetical protein